MTAPKAGWAYDRENWRGFPDEPEAGDIGYAFKDGWWAVLQATEVSRVECKSKLLIPSFLRPKPVVTLRWDPIQCLTPDGRILECETR